MESQMLSVLLASILAIIPYAFIWLVGILIAIVTWRRHPRLSLLVTITLLLFIVHQIISTALAMAFPLIQAQIHIALATLSLYYGLFNLIIVIPLWALIFWAIFGWRTSAPTGGSPQITKW